MSDSSHALLERNRSATGQFLSKRDGENKLTRRKSSASHNLQRAILGDFERHGVAAIEKWRERDPAGYIKYVSDYLGITKGAGARQNIGIAITVKHYDSAAPGDSSSAVTIEAQALDTDDTESEPRSINVNAPDDSSGDNQD